MDITLAVGEGESHVILGPSGAGKTTLLECVIGFRRPERGTIRLAGRNLAGVAIERREIGYLPQRLALFPHLSVRENILYGARVRGLPAAQCRPAMDALIEATGIGPLLDRRPATLSGGERQRVALVRALAARPRLLLLDEPFSALNETLRRELWWLLKALQQEHGLTTVMITHALGEAFFLGKSITVLIDGHVQQSADTDTVWHRPATVTVANYLGITNLWPGTVVSRREKTVEVECPRLPGRLNVAAPAPGKAPQPGSAVMVGIRPEFVALRDGDHPPGTDDCVLTGTISAVHETGTEATLLFQPRHDGPGLEIRLGCRVLRKFGVVAGQELTVSLPPDDLFLIAP